MFARPLKIYYLSTACVYAIYNLLQTIQDNQARLHSLYDSYHYHFPFPNGRLIPELPVKIIYPPARYIKLAHPSAQS